MVCFPGDRRYTIDHHWVRVSGDIATIGITDYAQRQVGEVVALQLPQAGAPIESDDGFGGLETGKVVIEVVTPVSGVIVEVNDVLAVCPSTVNDDPYGAGWMVRVRVPDTSELDGLMSSETYAAYVAWVDA